ATKLSIARAVKGEPSAKEATEKRDIVKHPFQA
ncbi:formaldehyde-activating enzyme involved in methanogenesis, partial [Xanthobacter agilis]|nr:formaldehyde-activating enzyme involved in methanogenesis [Xanthobacter agilis]MDQ0505622.1 formaldehyde-activating enzyme involved in methanogenesis [Xanthobacter agilis]